MKQKKIYLCCEAEKKGFYTEKAERMYRDYPMVDIVPEPRLADTVFIIGAYTGHMQAEIKHLKETLPKLDVQRVDTNFVNPDIYKLIRDSKTVTKTAHPVKEMGR